ncbi:MAG: 16S rRNA methyltransferase [Candidatus Bathyarchaeia archaeon]
MLILILAESALETIPEQLWNHPAVQKYSKLRRKHPRFLLLDRSFHHSAMKTLKHNMKRGRPDIVHFALLEALGSPLNKENLLQTYVHTINNHVITVNPQTRLPRNYSRFLGLMEQLFESGKVPPKGSVLLTLEHKTLPQLIREVKPSRLIAFSRIGTRKTLEETTLKLSSEKRPTILVGGFPHGHFTKQTLKLADEIVCTDPQMLETWTVVSRVVYEYERALSLPKKRLERR